MSSFPCLQSSRRALYRVFVERHEALLARQFLPATQATLPSIRQARFFSASSLQLRPPREFPDRRPTRSDDDGIDRRYTTKEEFAKSGRDRLPKDHEIKDPKVMVLDNGVFDGPLATRTVMSRLNETESLRMVTPYIPANDKNNQPVQYAVCKIVNKKEEFERQRELRERRRVSKQTTAKTKELEMSWAISDHDLQTKTRQLMGFLGKGMKVDLVLGFKKKGQKKRVDDAMVKDVIEKVKKQIEEAGAREYKPREGEPGRTLRIYLEGIVKQDTAPKDAPKDADKQEATAQKDAE
ncbi:hypothetical protein FSARC_2203 [Fusarium sarcochroum]|uniref:Translation initiation factor 3 C-terminal domain-containing protein n=1 Tax=Fusarium sarcochroum TaxID=1208366 RepID=A0A8H4U6W8_9HYPO|nr:hypothetical protein FSARC_2203 [Fusarium sarcochroum]